MVKARASNVVGHLSSWSSFGDKEGWLKKALNFEAVVTFRLNGKRYWKTSLVRKEIWDDDKPARENIVL
jgi:hypothetical protein